MNNLLLTSHFIFKIKIMIYAEHLVLEDPGIFLFFFSFVKMETSLLLQILFPMSSFLNNHHCSFLNSRLADTEAFIYLS